MNSTVETGFAAPIGAGIAVIGTVLSAVPVYVILSSKKIRENYIFQLLANLSIAETFLLLVYSVLTLTITLKISTSTYSCFALISISLTLFSVSSLALFCVIFERYVSVVLGLRYNELLNDSNKAALIALPWIFGVVGSSVLFMWMCYFVEKLYDGCYPVYLLPKYIFSIIAGICLLLNFITALMNYSVAMEAERHSKVINKQRITVGEVESHDPSKCFRSVKYLVYLTAVFMMPSNLLLFLDQLVFNIPDQIIWYSLVAALLAYILDGWVVGLMHSELQKQYVKIFCRRSRKISPATFDIEMQLRSQPSEENQDLGLEAMEHPDNELHL